VARKKKQNLTIPEDEGILEGLVELINAAPTVKKMY